MWVLTILLVAWICIATHLLIKTLTNRLDLLSFLDLALFRGLFTKMIVFYDFGLVEWIEGRILYLDSAVKMNRYSDYFFSKP